MTAQTTTRTTASRDKAPRPKSLASFLEDVKRELPGELIHVTKVVDPAHYDVTAIIKKLDALKKFPIIIFDKPLNLKGQISDIPLIMNAEISRGKVQVALDLPRSASRVDIAEECLRREEHRVPPQLVSKEEAPVKEVIKVGEEADLTKLPIMRHHEMDGGPYIVMASTVKDRKTGVYNTSYHRMEIKGPRLTAFYSSPRHLWRIFKDYEDNGLECPVSTVLGHHPAFNMGACYQGPFEVDEYHIIGGYLGEPLRLVPSETFGDAFMVPADADMVMEGALIPGKRMVEGPFGEAPGYLGPQRYNTSLRYEVRAITYRRGAMIQSIITPEGDKPWLDIAREGAYLRRVREAVPGVKAVCKSGRHAHYSIYISMKKMAEGDQGRAAAAAFTFDHTKNVFVFDEDIDVFDPTDILWALATRVQPQRDISIIKDVMRGNMLDPSLGDEIKTSAMIVDATRPLGRPYSPVSKCPEDALARIKLEDFVPREILDRIPLDRTTYWA
ncbi:MAG: UbiD family decarboxylase [Chloroflexi bacterium]|nr:UbiD family decarboxylase [Chloroflexota bacterium]